MQMPTHNMPFSCAVPCCRYHVRQQAQRLQEGAASEDAAAAAASAVWTVVMVAEGKAAARWVHRLQRRGVLQRLLETHLVPYLGSEGGREGGRRGPYYFTH